MFEGIKAKDAKDYGEVSKNYEILKAIYAEYKDRLSKKESKKLYQKILDFYDKIKKK